MFEVPIRKDEILKHLEEKYHEHFLLRTSMSVSLDLPYAEITLNSESHPDTFFRLYDDGTVIRDNYFSILAQKPMQALIEQAVKDAGGSGKVFFRFRSHFFPDTCVDPDQLTGLLEKEGDFLTADIFLFADRGFPPTEQDFRRICDTLAERNIGGSLACYTVDAAKLVGLNARNYKEYLVSDYSIAPVFSAYLNREGA